MSKVATVDVLRRFLKERLQRDYTTFRGNEEARENLRQLMQRTAEFGESNSLLLVGPRSSGKTTLINAALADLLPSVDFVENTLIVLLNGQLHTDDRLALDAITVQLKLENAADDKSFGSFAENLAFLLACLKSGGKRAKSIIFILEEFDLFCTHHNQTLLYNLFDVAQSTQAPICVIGNTNRLDVVELLEKRVKSRFSHRQVFLFPNARELGDYVALFVELLSVPSEQEMKIQAERVQTLQKLQSPELTFQHNHFDPAKYKFKRSFREHWNAHVQTLAKSGGVRAALNELLEFNNCESLLKSFLYCLVAELTSEEFIAEEQITELAESFLPDDKIEMLCDLSVLELCLIIAIKHHSDIYDRDPFNFEIIFTRFMKFAKLSNSLQGVERILALKAFEHLRLIELILPLSATSTSKSSKVQKEFEMHKFAVTNGQLKQALARYTALPTDVSQWAHTSLN